jgi:signal transduction histidine kinase
MSSSRLATLVSILFVALAVPAAALVWLGFRQLDLESFRLQQIGAETFVASVDTRLAAVLAREAARPAAEYSFALGGTGAADGIVQRSPLASLAAGSEIPGAIGYFQVDANGRLSTPLLPAGRDFARFGLRDAGDIEARLAIAAMLEAVLADNRLVDRPPSTVSAAGSAGPAASVAEVVVDQGSVAGASENDAARFDAAGTDAASMETALAESAGDDAAVDEARRRAAGGATASAPRRPDDADGPAAAVTGSAGVRGQAAFDRLVIGSEASVPAATERAADAPARPAAIDPAATGRTANEATTVQLPQQRTTTARVAAFDTALGPLVFSRLDTGQFVLFRDAWRDGRRDVQGILIDDEAFLNGALLEPFAAAGFAPGVRLHVDTDGPAPADTDGRAILRTRLAPPLAGIALGFTAVDLPASPARGVLVWSAVVLFGALFGGMYMIYRFGTQQIALARQQRTFVSAVTHELRTPLTSIRMYGEMLRAGWASEAKKQEYYDFIFAESERLSRLIDNVLMLAQIERGREPALETVTIGAALDTIATRVAAAVERAGFTLTVTADSAVRALSVRIDPDGLVQIFVNLIDNALKFSAAAERREIVLSAYASSDGRGVLRVRDFGPGLASKDLKRLFDLFYRPDTALTRSVAGTGIGLALVRRLAAEVDGRVDAVNASPGAMFSLSLPVADSRSGA